MTEDRLDTAFQYWDNWWGEARSRERWKQPETAVTEFTSVLSGRGARRVLDVGTGIGRHALEYERLGFEVVATDASPVGLEEVDRAARERELRVEVHHANFTDLPLEDSSVDHVLAWNVVYHGDGAVVSAALAECRRVLKDGGTIQLTMLSKRHRAYGVGRQIRPDTFVDESSTGDKDHPHFYVDAIGLTGILSAAGFDPLSLSDVDQDGNLGFHWVVSAETSPRRTKTRPSLAF